MGCMKKLIALKDQIMFVFFQLLLYIVDIGTDIKQAVEYAL